MKIVATIEVQLELGERDIYEGMTLAEAVDSELQSISIHHAAGIEILWAVTSHDLQAAEDEKAAWETEAESE